MTEAATPRPEVARAFLEPSSVAVVGASASTGDTYKAGGRAVLDHLARYGYRGEVTAVHRTAGSIEGFRAVPSLRELATPPDVVVIAVPTGGVLDVLADCAAIGARQALILTAGFGDMGPDGLAGERALLDYAAAHGINVVGPNSTGLVTAATGLAMSMTSVLTDGIPFAEGRLAVIAQSGAIGSTVVERARDAGVGVSHIVSTGNQHDVDLSDFIAYFAGHPGVDTVALYLESIRDGGRFTEAVRRLHGAGKRLVAYLGGRSAAGELAAASHTGKIVGRGALELGLLHSLGVLVVDDPDDLWVLGGAALPPGEFPRDWGMVAYSGGMAVLACEQLGGAGVRFPPLGPATVQRLHELLPTFATIPNPLDVGPGSMPHDFLGCLTEVAADDAVRAVCLPLPMGARGWNAHSVAHVLEVREKTGKPFVVLWYGGQAVRPYVEELRRAGVLVAESPAALGRVARALIGPSSPESADDRYRGTPRARGGAAALTLLAEAGLPVASMRVTDAGGAAAAARELGHPVVVKSAAAEIAHRTELGLVAVALRTEAEVEAAVRRMGGGPGPWLVQRMVSGGPELVVTVRDAGRLGMFGGVGAGGAAVEVLRDVVQIPLPCDQAGVRAALRRLRTHELMSGYRGAEPVDVAGLAELLNGLAGVLTANDLAEIELNPVLGGVIVDALLVEASP